MVEEGVFKNNFFSKITVICTGAQDKRVNHLIHTVHIDRRNPLFSEINLAKNICSYLKSND